MGPRRASHGGRNRCALPQRESERRGPRAAQERSPRGRPALRPAHPRRRRQLGRRNQGYRLGEAARVVALRRRAAVRAGGDLGVLQERPLRLRADRAPAGNTRQRAGEPGSAQPGAQVDRASDRRHPPAAARREPRRPRRQPRAGELLRRARQSALRKPEPARRLGRPPGAAHARRPAGRARLDCGADERSAARSLGFGLGVRLGGRESRPREGRSVRRAARAGDLPGQDRRCGRNRRGVLRQGSAGHRRAASKGRGALGARAERYAGTR